MEEPAEDPGGKQKHPGSTRTRDRTKLAELFADERCSRAVLELLAITAVGKTAGPPVAEAEETDSEVSEWERREREEHLAQMAEEGARLEGRRFPISFPIFQTV